MNIILGYDPVDLHWNTPSLELLDVFIVPDMDTTSISVQWSRGTVSVDRNIY